MPMPEAGPNFFSPQTQNNAQPQLLEERRAWVKKDRDVKLDIFLSISDDIKLEVFEVGPPLPPFTLTAKEMMEALDNHFETFSFEDYHHVFCYFLNLHIDQYSNIDEFNTEFKAILDDLLDHGHPLTNVQACSAYFSKLRCTQNPWVAKQIKAWDARDSEPELARLMEKSPPWSIIRPLTTSGKDTLHRSVPSSIPEHMVDTPPHSDGEYTPSEHSISTVSSKPSHSRDSSNTTQRSQEITIHASYEDLNALQQLDAFPNVPTSIPAKAPKRISSVSKFSSHSIPPINRPLPPIPVNAQRSRSTSPNPTVTSKPRSAKTPIKVPSPTTSLPGLEQVHPALRSSPREPLLDTSQLDMRSLAQQAATPPPTVPLPRTPSLPEPSTATLATHIASVISTTPPTPSSFLSATPELNVTLAPPSTPDLLPRPMSSRSAVSSQDHFSNWAQSKPLLRVDSQASSVLSLPLQGIIRSATPEFTDTTITEAETKAPTKKSPSKIELARLKFEGMTGSPPRGFLAPNDEEKRFRKRSWSIKARLSARHGIKEII